MNEHKYLTEDRISEIKSRIDAFPENLDSQTRFVYRLVSCVREHDLKHGLMIYGDAKDDWPCADIWANSSRDIRDLLSDLDALRAELKRTQEEFKQTEEARLAMVRTASESARECDEQREQISQLTRERDEAQSLLASATDLLNSWARESYTTEAKTEADIKGVIDRLWSYWSAEVARLREQAEEAKQHHVCKALESKLRAEIAQLQKDRDTSAARMLESVRASLREYPHGGGDIEIMCQVERITAEKDAEIARLREELCWTQAVVVEERSELDRMRKALEEIDYELRCAPDSRNLWKSVDFLRDIIKRALNPQPAQQETICGFPVVINNKLASPEDKGQSVVFGPVPQEEK